jgi:cytochrome c556
MTIVARFALVCGVGAVIVGCSNQSAPPPASAPAASAPVATAPLTATPRVSINEVMVSLVDHAGHELWNVEKDGKHPKTNADWIVIEEHAVQMVAAGPAITVGGTGPSDAVWVKSPDWQKHAQALSDAGADALKAAKAKNYDALVTANGKIVESCENCHKQFKPALPTEGITHAHTHEADTE